MHTHNLLHGLRQHLERIVIADIVLRGEGDVLDIRQRLDFIARHAGRLEPLVIEGDVLVTIINHSFQPLELQRLQLGTAHGFNFFLKKHSYTSERPAGRFCALALCIGWMVPT